MSSSRNGWQCIVVVVVEVVGVVGVVQNSDGSSLPLSQSDPPAAKATPSLRAKQKRQEKKKQSLFWAKREKRGKKETSWFY